MHSVHAHSRSCSPNPPTEPLISEHEPSINSTEAHQHDNAADINAHTSTCRKLGISKHRQLPPEDTNFSASRHSAPQTVNPAYGDFTPLTHQILHRHGRETKSQHYDKVEQYMQSQSRTYGDNPPSDSQTKIHHHIYPTFIKKVNIGEPVAQIEVNFKPAQSIYIQGSAYSGPGYDFIGIGAQFPHQI